MHNFSPVVGKFNALRFLAATDFTNESFTFPHLFSKSETNRCWKSYNAFEQLNESQHFPLNSRAHSCCTVPRGIQTHLCYKPYSAPPTTWQTSLVNYRHLDVLYVQEPKSLQLFKKLISSCWLGYGESMQVGYKQTAVPPDHQVLLSAFLRCIHHCCHWRVVSRCGMEKLTMHSFMWCSIWHMTFYEAVKLWKQANLGNH